MALLGRAGSSPTPGATSPTQAALTANVTPLGKKPDKTRIFWLHNLRRPNPQHSNRPLLHTSAYQKHDQTRIRHMGQHIRPSRLLSPFEWRVSLLGNPLRRPRQKRSSQNKPAGKPDHLSSRNNNLHHAHTIPDKHIQHQRPIRALLPHRRRPHNQHAPNRRPRINPPSQKTPNNRLRPPHRRNHQNRSCLHPNRAVPTTIPRRTRKHHHISHDSSALLPETHLNRPQRKNPMGIHQRMAQRLNSQHLQCDRNSTGGINNHPALPTRRTSSPRKLPSRNNLLKHNRLRPISIIRTVPQTPSPKQPQRRNRIPQNSTHVRNPNDHHNTLNPTIAPHNTEHTIQRSHTHPATARHRRLHPPHHTILHVSGLWRRENRRGSHNTYKKTSEKQNLQNLHTPLHTSRHRDSHMPLRAHPTRSQPTSPRRSLRDSNKRHNTRNNTANPIRNDA